MTDTINIEYPFIAFISVFEIVLVFLLSMSNITVTGIGTIPDSPTSLLGIPYYALNLLWFFLKLLIVPTVPITLKFLSTLILVPISLVFGWIIFKVTLSIVAIIGSFVP